MNSHPLFVLKLIYKINVLKFILSHWIQSESKQSWSLVCLNVQPLVAFYHMQLGYCRNLYLAAILAHLALTYSFCYIQLSTTFSFWLRFCYIQLQFCHTVLLHYLLNMSFLYMFSFWLQLLAFSSDFATFSFYIEFLAVIPLFSVLAIFFAVFISYAIFILIVCTTVSPSITFQLTFSKQHFYRISLVQSDQELQFSLLSGLPLLERHSYC